MDDLISRQMAIDEFDGVKVNEEYCTEYDIGYNDGIDFAISKLSVLPTAERKGNWENYLKEGLRYKCSVCGSRYNLAWNYCPNCGSKNGGCK